jgi:hypothetical protein
MINQSIVSKKRRRFISPPRTVELTVPAQSTNLMGGVFQRRRCLRRLTSPLKTRTAESRGIQGLRRPAREGSNDENRGSLTSRLQTPVAMSRAAPSRLRGPDINVSGERRRPRHRVDDGVRLDVVALIPTTAKICPIATRTARGARYPGTIGLSDAHAGQQQGCRGAQQPFAVRGPPTLPREPYARAVPLTPVDSAACVCRLLPQRMAAFSAIRAASALSWGTSRRCAAVHEKAVRAGRP